MRELTRQCLTVLLAVALVSSAVSPVGTASAQFGEKPRDCSALDKYVVAVTWSLGAGLTDCKFGPPDVDPAEGVEAQQVQSELYSAALSATESQEAINVTYGNLLEDASTISKIEGKNAVVRALDNGSVEEEAELAGVQAVEDFYAQKQVNFARSLLPEMRTMVRIANSSMSEKNLSVGKVIRTSRATGTDKYNVFQINNRSKELINGSTVDLPVLKFSESGVAYNGTVYVSAFHSHADDTYQYTFVNPEPPSDYEHENASKHLKDDKIEGYWQNIKDQAAAQKSQIRNFTSEVYPQYESGVIGTEDLVDPYLGAREFDPTENGETWAMRSLTAMGIQPPANVSNLERMEIRDEETGVVYNGTLMAQADPPGEGGYAVGTTYNTSNINGDVFVSTNEGPRPLDGEFTILSADRIDGESYGDGETITYDRPDYDTMDLSEFKQMHEEQMRIREDLEAREQRIEANASGEPAGGLFDFDGLGASLPFGGAGIVVGLGAIVVLGLLTRN